MISWPVERYFLIISVLYAIFGMAMGIHMGIQNDFTYAHVHAHINLVGWVSLAVFGIVYKLYPNAGRSKLGVIHFIIANLGAIIFLPGIYIAMATTGDNIVFAVIGSLLTLLSMLTFLVNLIINAR
jgi:cbb3-type cytochrome oxidase subunit 1